MTKLKQGLRAVGKKIFDDVFDREEVNLVAALADSALCVHAAAAGKKCSSNLYVPVADNLN
jgi:amidase